MCMIMYSTNLQIYILLLNLKAILSSQQATNQPTLGDITNTWRYYCYYYASV